MIDPPLILSDQALTDRKILHRDLAYIKIADRTFRLGLDRTPFKQEREIFDTAFVLGERPHMGMNVLMWLGVRKKLTKEERREIQDEGMADDRKDAKIWRAFDRPDIADLLDEYYDLSEDVEIEIVREDGHVWPEIKNYEGIEERMKILWTRAQTLSEEARYSVDEMTSTVCKKFNLELRPLDAFNQYWISRIIQAPGFQTFAPREDNSSWFLANEPYGWLTKRHGAALEKHGYTYKFALWEQEIGYTRGHLWIQTDRGPLRLTDTTDATSLRSNFPVQVSTVEGEHLFMLLEADVPDHLMRDGPDIPPDLSARRSKKKKPTKFDPTSLPNWLRKLVAPNGK